MRNKKPIPLGGWNLETKEAMDLGKLRDSAVPGNRLWGNKLAEPI
jgi:hypothetical protein